MAGELLLCRRERLPWPASVSRGGRESPLAGERLLHVEGSVLPWQASASPLSKGASPVAGRASPVAGEPLPWQASSAPTRRGELLPRSPRGSAAGEGAHAAVRPLPATPRSPLESPPPHRESPARPPRPCPRRAAPEHALPSGVRRELARSGTARLSVCPEPPPGEPLPRRRDRSPPRLPGPRARPRASTGSSRRTTAGQLYDDLLHSSKPGAGRAPHPAGAALPPGRARPRVHRASSRASTSRCPAPTGAASSSGSTTSARERRSTCSARSPRSVTPRWWRAP